MWSYDHILIDNIGNMDIIIVRGGNLVNTNRATMSDISSYLAQVKKLMAVGKYVFVPRRKNMQALAYHGMTLVDVKDEIMGLVVEDYYKGPKQDFDLEQSGDIWEFKKDIDGKQFYVKLKIQKQNGEDILKCLSFHEDDYSKISGGE